MKRTILFSIFSLGLLFVGCSKLQQMTLETDRNEPFVIGQIVAKEGGLKTNVEIKGMPKAISKMQVSVVEKPMTSKVNAKLEHKLNRLDSAKQMGIASYSSYIEIELLDDIEFAHHINEDTTLSNYIQQSKSAGVITQVSGVVKREVIQGSTAVFLENAGSQSFDLVFYNGDVPQERFPFNALNIFDFQVSYFCYGKNDRNQIRVLDIVEEGKRCKRPLERKVKNLLSTKKLVDY